MVQLARVVLAEAPGAALLQGAVVVAEVRRSPPWTGVALGVYAMKRVIASQRFKS